MQCPNKKEQKNKQRFAKYYTDNGRSKNTNLTRNGGGWVRGVNTDAPEEVAVSSYSLSRKS